MAKFPFKGCIIHLHIFFLDSLVWTLKLHSVLIFILSLLPSFVIWTTLLLLKICLW